MKPRTVEDYAVAAYFARRHEKSFCVVYCPNYRPLSETCEAVDSMDAGRCPDKLIAMKEVS